LVGDVVAGFLLGSATLGGLAVTGNKRLDASAWILGQLMLVSLVNLEYGPTTGVVTVQLPAVATGVNSVLWGNGDWIVSGGMITINGTSGLQVDLIMLDL